MQTPDRVEYCCIGEPNSDQQYDNVKQISNSMAKQATKLKKIREINTFIQQVSWLVAAYKAHNDEDTQADL